MNESLALVEAGFLKQFQDKLEYALTQARPNPASHAAGRQPAIVALERMEAQAFNNVIEEVSKLGLLPVNAFDRLYIKGD